MTQQEVLDVLKKNGWWMTTKKVSEATKKGTSSTIRCLNILFRNCEILRREISMDVGKDIPIWMAKE